MQIVSRGGDNLHEMSKLVLWGKKKKNISKCHPLKFSPCKLSIKKIISNLLTENFDIKILSL